MAFFTFSTVCSSLFNDSFADSSNFLELLHFFTFSTVCSSLFIDRFGDSSHFLWVSQFFTFSTVCSSIFDDSFGDSSNFLVLSHCAVLLLNICQVDNFLLQHHLTVVNQLYVTIRRPSTSKRSWIYDRTWLCRLLWRIYTCEDISNSAPPLIIIFIYFAIMQTNIEISSHRLILRGHFEYSAEAVEAGSLGTLEEEDVILWPHNTETSTFLSMEYILLFFFFFSATKTISY